MAAERLLEFHKMHGAGNDFVLLDLRQQEASLDQDLAQLLASRRTGIGCDQILLLLPPRNDDSLAAYEIRNADGSSAGQCGNGARCIALYLMNEPAASASTFRLDSPAGPIEVRRCEDGEFELDMGQPRFEPAQIPLRLVPENHRYTIASPWGELHFLSASMGNPHALLEVSDIASAPVSEQGRFLASSPVFPAGCNIGFVQLESRQRIHLRVHERGVGETLACGSGACAAVAMLRRQDRVDERVEVVLPGGILVVQWRGSGHGVRMKGPAVHVFSGTIRI